MSSTRNRAFTLLEIMLAVAVLGLVGISLYRFVETTLSAVRLSSEETTEKERLASLGAFLRAQMQNLPVRLGAITGEPHVFDGAACDELRWIAAAGNGLLTRHAQGEYNVTLTTQRNEAGGTELGLRRQDIDAREAAGWLPLMDGVNGFEVRYYDARSQEWMEKWTDLAVRPALVRVRLWRGSSPDPQEWVLSIPFASASAQVPNLNFNRGRRAQRRGRDGNARNRPEAGSPPANHAPGTQPPPPPGRGGPPRRGAIPQPPR